MDAYRDLLMRRGMAFEVTPLLDGALCESALQLASDTGRDELAMAFALGRFTDGRRRLLILPPTHDILLAVQEVALLAAQDGGAVGRRARELADRIARIVGYRRAPRRFRVIYADPPWPYRKHGGQGHGAARDHYPTMSIEEIKNFRVDLGWGPRRVRDLADPSGCALVIWIPAPKLEAGLEVIRAWGFELVTKAFLWVKKTKTGKAHFGTGVYTRQNDEDAWLGKIGQIPPHCTNVRREITAPVNRHSAKPHEVYERIEALWPEGPYLELFGRTRRAGWCTVGNDPSVAQGRILSCPKEGP